MIKINSVNYLSNMNNEYINAILYTPILISLHINEKQKFESQNVVQKHVDTIKIYQLQFCLLKTKSKV